MGKNFLQVITILLVLVLSACQTVSEIESKAVVIDPAPPPINKPKPIAQKPDATPILNPNKSDIVFAQSSLKALGYTIGNVDGVWGKRSIQAIQAFEKNQDITSANGNLSSLNLALLQNTHKPLARRFTNTVDPTPTKGIASKLTSQEQTSSMPELIIVDKDYSLLAKPNPFSEVVVDIEAGTGVYVVMSLQSGWYEIETLANQHGYIKEN